MNDVPDPAAPTRTHACTVCLATLDWFDRGRVLTRYDVDFFRCPRCGLIALPEPTWLAEAYASPLYDGDCGLARRNRIAAGLTGAVIRTEGLRGGRFLDFGGGHGALAAILRERGHDMATYDAYAENTEVPGHDGDPGQAYDLVTSFEVLEHLVDPVAELAALAEHNDRLLISTQLQPRTPPRPDRWWYYQLDSGQHVTLYTHDALRRLAARLGYELTSNGDQFHLLHRVPLRPGTRALLSPRVAAAKGGIARTVRRLRGLPTE